MMMFPFHYRRAAISTLLVSLAFLALTSCGGGGGSGGEPPPGACGEGAASGETVVCSVAGMNFSCDCTVFFGTTPVEAACDEADQTITFTVPPSAPGPKTVSSQCGDDEPKTIQEGFSVQPPAPQPISCEDNSDCPGGQVCQEGVCTNPANPGGSAPEPPSGSPPPPPPPEAPPAPPPEAPPPEAPPPPECTVDADCTGGKVCQGGSCVPPPPPPPLEVSFVTSGADKTEALHGTKLGLVRIKWSITGGGNLQKAYIYGPFNRISDLEGCEKEGTRYPAVTLSGNQIAEGTGAFTTYQKYLTGEKCGAATGNCHGFEPVEGDPTICKIDLMELGTGGTFYTRFLKMNSAETAEFVIVAQAEDGTWKFDEKSFPVPEPNFTSPPVVTINGNSPTVDVQFHYSNAWNVSLNGPPAGCDPAPSMPATVADDPVPILTDPSGDVVTSCKLKEGLIFMMMARGIDPTVNFKWEMFTIQCDNPQLAVTNGAFSQDEAGNVLLYGWVTRSCTVKRWQDGAYQTVSTTNVPWVKDLEIKGTGNGVNSGSACGTSDVKTIPLSGTPLPAGVTRQGENLKLTWTLPRNHDCTHYEFRVRDLDGALVPKKTKSFPYGAYFETYNQQGPELQTGGYDSCGDTWEGNCGQCVEGSGVYYQGKVNFRGRHIQLINVGCTTTYGTASYQINVTGPSSSNQANRDVYGEQTGWIGVKSYIGNADDWSSRLDCDFSATTYTGSTAWGGGWWWSLDCTY